MLLAYRLPGEFARSFWIRSLHCIYSLKSFCTEPPPEQPLRAEMNVKLQHYGDKLREASHACAFGPTKSCSELAVGTCWTQYSLRMPQRIWVNVPIMMSMSLGSTPAHSAQPRPDLPRAPMLCASSRYRYACRAPALSGSKQAHWGFCLYATPFLKTTQSVLFVRSWRSLPTKTER